MRIVIDTNIIISAALSAQGNPARIMEYIWGNGDVKLYYNAVIMAEYKRVLSYERLNIPYIKQNMYLEAIQEIGTIVHPSKSKIAMPDESDRIFYDTAKACAAYLITGNKKHYPDEPFINTPSQFVAFMENEN